MNLFGRMPRLTNSEHESVIISLSEIWIFNIVLETSENSSKSSTLLGLKNTSISA